MLNKSNKWVKKYKLQKTNLDRNKVNHYNFIDIGKSFALFCVVVMHSIQDNGNPIFKIAQMGCMAYFFFASGFCFREDYYKYPTIKYIIKNIKSLVIPYFICSYIGIFLCFRFPEWYTNDLTKIFNAILLEEQPVAFGLVWFLLCLFKIKILFFLFWKLIGWIQTKEIKLLLTIGFYTAIMRLSIYLIDNIIILPNKISVAVVALTFYILGFLVNYLEIYKWLDNISIAGLVFLVSKIIGVYLENTYMISSNIVSFVFNNYSYWQIIQILSIISFMSIGMILYRISFFVYLGKNTFYPYLVHALVLWYIEEIYGKYITGTVNYSLTSLNDIFIVSSATFIISYLISELLKRIMKQIII